MEKRYLALSVICTALLLAMLGCGGAGSDAENGVAGLRISLRVTPESCPSFTLDETSPRQGVLDLLATITVTVTGDDFSPISETFDVGETIRILVLPGEGRNFMVEGRDENGQLVCTGGVTSDVLLGGTAITIPCVEVSPSPTPTPTASPSPAPTSSPTPTPAPTTTPTPSPTIENCANGIDDDGDGEIDCDDLDCFFQPSCLESGSECGDGLDNDGDSRIDCADSNCVGQQGPCGETCQQVETSCDDGFDNDGDGLIDCLDPSCNGSSCSINNILGICTGGLCVITQTPPPGIGSVSGTVTDATTGFPIPGVTVDLIQNQSIIDSAITEPNGNYVINNITPGTYTLVASAEDFLSSTVENVQVVDEQNTPVNFSLSPPLPVGQLRIVLTWGQVPSDLDSHLWLPSDTPYHIAFFRVGNSTVCPFAELDVDDTSSFGPETITISQRFSGTYHYAIHNFSGSPDITTSGAQVQVFDDTGLILTLNIPTTGTGLWWNVLTIDGISGNITVIDQIVGDPGPLPYPDTDEGCTETGSECSDQIDNDGDGFTDCLDSDCSDSC